MIFDVRKLENYIRLKYNIKKDIEIEMFMDFKIDYGIYFRHKLENESISYRSSYQYLDMEEYKSYLRDEKLKQLGI